MPPLSCNRLVTLTVFTFILLVAIFSSSFRNGRHEAIQTIKDDAARLKDTVKDSAQSVKDGAKSVASSAQHYCADNIPDFAKPTFQNSIFNLYSYIKLPPTAERYTDSLGKQFKVMTKPIWTTPLGNDILIVDMDTRAPEGSNEIFGPDKINWETMSDQEGGGMLSAAFFNHFLYSQIHGYDYKYVRAQPIKDHHDTWIKPHVLSELLHNYRFVVFMDADSTIQHLEVPMEWLFNRWNITERTSIAMAQDTKQKLKGDDTVSLDSKGNVELNTGFVVAQSMPYTFDMLTAWGTCTGERRFEGCGKWKDKWSHEQRAFSEFVRYAYNPEGDNIVEIPCDDAMGYPGLKANHKHILSDCTGQFVRHHTADKQLTKGSAGAAMLQSLSEVVQMTAMKNLGEIFVKEGEGPTEFMKKYKEKVD